MANTSLITLQTDLKSLRYGSDKPYITKDVNDPPSSNQTGMQITKRVDDLSRIAQMLIDRPGLKFIGNQALLQQVDVQGKLQKARDKKTTLGGKVFEQVKGTVLNTAKILGSTIAQVPVNGTGTHFVYAFRTDTYLQPSGGNQRSAFAQFFGAGGVEGAPLALRGKNITGKVESNFGEPNQQTGEFKLTSESELDYDEKVNTQIPQGENRIYSQQGTPIVEDNVGIDGWKPYTSTGVKENFVDRNSNQIVSQSKFSTPELSKKTRVKPSGSVVSVTSAEIFNPFTGDPLTLTGLETTATPNTNTAQNLIKSIPHTGSISGDINPDSSNNVSSASYSYENTFTGTSTDTAITNAQNNSPIKVTAPGTGQRETTATSGSSLVTGTANTGYTDENTSNPADELGLTVPTGSRYTKEESYGTNVSDYSTGVAPFITQNAQFYNQEDDTVDLDTLPIHQIDLVTRENIGNVIVGSVIPRDKYNSEGKYYEQQKRRTINGTEKNVIRETRVNLGDQGFYKGRAYYADYSSTNELSEDKLNALDIQNSRPDGVDEARDLAKFFFEIITPEGSKFLNFRAFITSMDDSYNANWEAKKYVGRADDFYTYGGFSRDISVGFKIAAATRSEMKPLYRKMVYLASTTAPTYGDYKFMRGTVVRLSLGSYFNEIPGVITSVKYTWSTDYPWEIAMESPEGGESGVQELPMVMDCSISFKPIHDFVPQTGLQHYITSKEPSKTFF